MRRKTMPKRMNTHFFQYFCLFWDICSSLVRIKFESASEKVPFLRTKLEFDCHLIQIKPLFVFFKMPYKVLGIIRSKHLAFILQVKYKQTFITLSLYIPLTFLWHSFDIPLGRVIYRHKITIQPFSDILNCAFCVD